MNKSKLVACVMLVLLAVSLFCLYIVAVNIEHIGIDTSEQRGIDVSFLFILGIICAGIVTIKLVNNNK